MTAAADTAFASDRTAHRRQIGRWLLVCSAAIFVMVVIGGITRLTESGLSMVEWRAFLDAVPPMSDAAWQRLFDLYRQTPEFQHKNFWMTLSHFQTIFWWEYIHRLWGRGLGLLFLIPFVWFLVKGRIEKPLLPALLLMFILGAVQGGIGWWMVKSGLVDRPDVSHYRLAVHLSVAFILHGVVLWWKLRRHADPAVRLPANLLALAVAGQYLLGIMTLLAHVPVSLGAAHQGGAFLLFTAALWTAHAVRRSG